MGRLVMLSVPYLIASKGDNLKDRFNQPEDLHKCKESSETNTQNI